MNKDHGDFGKFDKIGIKLQQKSFLGPYMIVLHLQTKLIPDRGIIF